jgi:hypothetical protein
MVLYRQPNGGLIVAVILYYTEKRAQTALAELAFRYATIVLDGT